MAGFAAVLDAVNQGRVWKLVYAKGLTKAGGECSDCSAYSPHEVGPCVYCGGEVQPLGQCVDRLSQSVIEMGGQVEVVAGAAAAWTAMSKPVQGTLPTVLDDFSKELTRRAADGVRDIKALVRHGLDAARESLANTPNQLPALKQAGVVDAGGQGFVDLMEGIWTFIEKGEVDSVVADLQADLTGPVEAFEVGEHRFCTECVIAGENLDRQAVMHRLEQLDASSLVVAGSDHRIRVHIHVNSPAEVYLVCEEFGRIQQQKADDM